MRFKNFVQILTRFLRYVQCSRVQCHTMQCRTTQCCTMQCAAIQFLLQGFPHDSWVTINELKVLCHFSSDYVTVSSLDYDYVMSSLQIQTMVLYHLSSSCQPLAICQPYSSAARITEVCSTLARNYIIMGLWETVNSTAPPPQTNLIFLQPYTVYM